MINIETALKAAPDKAIKDNAAKIAKALAGVTDRETLHNARGNVRLNVPGTDIFQVVAYLDAKMTEDEAAAKEKTAPKSAAGKE